ncbi:MAG TPA: M1 family metallopeptidase [Terriglobales bacterium]|nr:M1 family metallopeptidase [Terriglobales bacterium]
MKNVFFFVGLSLLASVCAAQRLPQIAVPESYQLSFAPDLTNNIFAGEESIQVRVLKPTSEIVLHAANIDFQNVSIAGATGAQQADVTLDKESQTAKLKVDKPLQPGPATIHIRYTGILNDQLRGFYIGKDDQGRKYAATQFEDTDARRAFPSFDEPAYKATFNVTVIADEGMTVISNGKVVSDTPGPGEAKHTVHFSTSPKMSSYLVAVVVGDFEYIQGEADGIPVRVWTSPGKKELGRFALAAAEFDLTYYDRYFGIKYPYGKLDLVGLADFSAGAMENTGCITFREVLLLLDEKHTALGLKKTVASVIAHEMAHQWFGDLVTMQWWDYKWLNEGFATWMASKPVAAWKPEWDVQLDEVSDTVNSAGQDSLVNTHPIHQPADTPAQILELDDAITYGKTAAVLRMLESYVGPEPFRAGVNLYLKQHSYANATASDFWNAQTQISKKPIDRIMPTWTEQAGLPLVTVKIQCSGKSETVALEQQRYFYDGAKMSAGSPERWQIPLCMKTAASTASNAACELVTAKQENFNLQGCSQWVYINASAKGFYRSHYRSEAILPMAKVAESALSPAERIMLLSDVWASVRVNREPIGDYLMLTEGLQADRSSAVLGEILKQLTYIGDHIVSDADREPYERWVRHLLAPVAQDVGWEAKPGESEERAALRAQLMMALGGVARDPQVEALAQKLANQYLADHVSVDHELAAVALRISARNGGQALYDRIIVDLKVAKTPEAYFTDAFALARFRDPKLIERTLEAAISGRMRSQDAPYMIAIVMQNPAADKQAWSFVQAHWGSIENLGGAFAGGVIVQSTGGFCDSTMRDEVQAFFASHPAPAAERSLKQSVERMNYCVDLKAQQGPQLSSWLRLRNLADAK